MGGAFFRQTTVTLALAAAIVFAGAHQAAAALIPVTTLKQKTNGVGECSLQEAIYSANFDASVAINGYSGSTPRYVTTQCVAGSGDDTIVLPAGALLTFTKIIDDAENAAGPTANPIITSRITLLAYGATLQRTGNVSFRLFTVANTGSLTISRAYIVGFRAKGGNGADGGGGGLGGGGAIFVTGGHLVVDATTFDGNSAQGGLGGPFGWSGGGGGMGGNGGGACQEFDSLFPEMGGGGGGGARGDGAACFGGLGGGGGGTVSSGTPGRAGGFACGGNGGRRDSGEDGHCAGGGGAGGGESAGGLLGYDGGTGKYGGGGGGGVKHGSGDGGRGGFGGGGGASGFAGYVFEVAGGNGGFGGGGGAADDSPVSDGDQGEGGFFGGDAGRGGGGGAGLGGAIFNEGGIVEVRNSTFHRNIAAGGLATHGSVGLSGGAAIFAVNGSLTVLNTTISGNQAVVGAGILVAQSSAGAPTSITIENSILANNGDWECAITGEGTIAGTFAGNLIMSNAGGVFYGRTFLGCQGVVRTSDPQLGALAYNQGATPTMAIGPASPAFNAADPGTSLLVDQRNSPRPGNGGVDIGAFEYCDERFGDIRIPCVVLTPVFDFMPVVDLTVQVQPPGGGTTVPAPGVHQVGLESVVALNAIPTPGYRFKSWSENVTNRSLASTTMFVQAPQTVTATFELCACAQDVTSVVGVSLGGVTMNPITRRYVQTVTLTNNSPTTITGPMSLVLDNLTAGVSLWNANGTTNFMLPPGSSYINASANLAPGQSIALQLQFTNAANVAFSYDPRVLAGPGSR